MNILIINDLRKQRVLVNGELGTLEIMYKNRKIHHGFRIISFIGFAFDFCNWLNKIILILYLLLIANFANPLYAQNIHEVKLCFYDLNHFASDASQECKNAVSEILNEISPDIVIFAGVANMEALNFLKTLIITANFAELIEGSDKYKHLAIISKFKPKEFSAITNLKYKIKDLELTPERGFIHTIFTFENYKFHLIGAHLRSRDKHPELNQTDIRRYEARLLRYFVTELIKENKDNNIIILGNLNDTCGMSPIKEIYNRRFDIIKRLYDIRPIDSFRTSWTAWNEITDDYERIDYAIANYSMLPEIKREKTFICENHKWENVSNHRPIVITISCKDLECFDKDTIEKFYPNAIYEGEAGHFEEDKHIGDKLKRNPPAK